VLDAIRDGRLDDVLDKRETPETLAAIKELDLHWINASSVHSDRNLTMRLRVTESGSAVPGARLTVRFARPDATPLYAQVVTDQAGDAEMKIEMDESSLPDSSVLVQASYSGRTATRKFQLKKVEASRPVWGQPPPAVRRSKAPQGIGKGHRFSRCHRRRQIWRLQPLK
jgi:hypothetical protein